MPRIEPTFLGRPVQSLVIIETELYGVPFYKYCWYIYRLRQNMNTYCFTVSLSIYPSRFPQRCIFNLVTIIWTVTAVWSHTADTSVIEHIQVAWNCMNTNVWQPSTRNRNNMKLLFMSIALVFIYEIWGFYSVDLYCTYTALTENMRLLWVWTYLRIRQNLIVT